MIQDTRKDRLIDFASTYTDRTEAIIDLFTASFAASEGADEGRVIGKLVTEMIASVSGDDMFVFSALDGTTLVGTILFTRMTYAQEARTVFLLSPVAVATARQGEGIGQSLLQYGLDRLRDNGVDVALTYGDINFYSRVGFRPITEAEAAAPQPLQYPEGWLGQSLSNRPFGTLRGPSSCVPALNDPAYW